MNGGAEDQGAKAGLGRGPNNFEIFLLQIERFRAHCWQKSVKLLETKPNVYQGALKTQ